MYLYLMWKYIYLAKVMSTHAKMFLLAMIATKYYLGKEEKMLTHCLKSKTDLWDTNELFQSIERRITL